MAETLRHPDLEPTHPGQILREIVLPALNMAIEEAAKHLRVSPQMLGCILSGEGKATPEMAVRIGKFCGNGPGLWIRMQDAYDLWHAERALADEIAAIPTFQNAA